MHLKAGVQSSYDFHNARSCVSSCRAHFIASFFFFLFLIARWKVVHYYSVFHFDTHAWDTGLKSAVQLVQRGYGKQDSFLIAAGGGVCNGNTSETSNWCSYCLEAGVLVSSLLLVFRVVLLSFAFTAWPQLQKPKLTYIWCDTFCNPYATLYTPRMRPSCLAITAGKLH